MMKNRIESNEEESSHESSMINTNFNTSRRSINLTELYTAWLFINNFFKIEFDNQIVQHP